jgi:N-methylhydantoinase B
LLEPGEISIHDDRWLTYPWGVNGGEPGMRSTKRLVRKDGSEDGPSSATASR